jgi:PKD domain-containing protein
MAMTKGFVATRSMAALAAALLIAAGGCGLDDVDVPEIDGPSELAQALRLTATPDLLVADGQSQSVITAVLRGPDGRPVPNQELFFTIADEDGRFAAIGSFPTSEGPGFAVSVRTDAQGLARVVYQAPPRTDATANQTVLIAVRPIGTDAGSAVYRTVRIELRSAEPRLFPPNPSNAAPTCNFVIEIPRSSCRVPPPPSPVPSAAPTPIPSPGTPTPAPTPTPTPAPPPGGGCPVGTNQPVLVQTTSSDGDGVIVRFLWDFGNGRQSDAPDAATSYSRPGVFSITHTVTDDDGGFSTCSKSVTVVP